MGGFSSAFDLISSEYGWHDDQILDLTLARMQQIVSTISIRTQSASRERKLELSWAVRTLASFVAAGYQTEDNSEAMEAVSNISIDDIEQAIMKSDLPVPPPEVKAGSTEKLMRAFR